MPIPFKTTPMAHQLNVLLREKPDDGKYFAYFADMGTGKSKMLIDDIVQMYTKGLIRGCVITTYKGVYMNWVNSELPKHFPDEIKLNVIYWRDGKLNGQYIYGRFNVLLVNVEAFSSTRKGGILDEVKSFLKREPMLMAIDESTCIKNYRAKRTINILECGKLAFARRILSGSPITNSPLDLYTQFVFLAGKILGFKSYYAFKGFIAKEQAIDLGGRSFKKIVGYHEDRLDILIERIKPYSYRITKEECLDLPPKVYTTYEVEMTSEQLIAYKSMQKYLITNVVIDNENVMFTTQTAVAQLMKLQQITSGFIIDTETGVAHAIGEKNAKIQALLECVEQCGKTIIWANFRHDIKAIEKALVKEYGAEAVCTYYGDTSSADREQAIEGFQNDERVRFFIGNQATAGYGLTLTAASTVIYFSNNFDIEKRQQSEDRAHRIGQTKSVTYIDIVCTGSIDEKIRKSLISKRAMQDVILVDGWKKVVLD